jgi:hypothetical protein
MKNLLVKEGRSGRLRRPGGRGKRWNRRRISVGAGEEGKGGVDACVALGGGELRSGNRTRATQASPPHPSPLPPLRDNGVSSALTRRLWAEGLIDAPLARWYSGIKSTTRTYSRTFL